MLRHARNPRYLAAAISIALCVFAIGWVGWRTLSADDPGDSAGEELAVATATEGAALFTATGTSPVPTQAMVTPTGSDGSVTSTPAGATSTAASPTPTTSPTSTPSAIPTAAQPTPEVTATPSPPAQSPTTVPEDDCQEDCLLIGVTLEDFPGSFESISQFGAQSGRMPELVMFFQAWGNPDAPFKPWLPDLSAMGVDPLITWEPWRRSEGNEQSDFTLDSIVGGVHDPYIRDWAEQAAAYGGRIYLRFAHEMNSPIAQVYWYPWQGDPQAYIAAWRHVHNIFSVAGADNVQWVWSVAWMNDDAQYYYPGNDYVDWVGLTVLNFGTAVEGSGWHSFAALYSAEDDGISQSERAASFGKPVMITEVASGEQGGSKEAWIAELGVALEEQFPEIGAIVWNNYSQARHEQDVDWRVDSSPEALAGWQRLMSNPYITSPTARMRQTWMRTDLSVSWRQVDRTWLWAPAPFTDVREEDYAESPGGRRLVRYYDKSRMEITNPDAGWASDWYVTNGLLATEMITGMVQRGDNLFEEWQPAQVNVGGDPDDPDGPTYASFNAVLNTEALPAGAIIDQRIDRDSNVTIDPGLASQNVTVGFHDDVTGHAIAAPFWAFMNSSGLVWEYGLVVEDALFENPFFATGRPITEAYWTDIVVGGQPKLVLVQCFERRCLTYTPGNAPEWQVEAGNVGRHYFTWRYE